MWAVFGWMNRDVFLIMRDLVRWLWESDVTPRLAHAVAVAATLGDYAGVVMANTASLLAWALYNQFRFRGKERRRSAAPVGLDEIAERCAVPSEDVDAWQSARTLVFAHDAAGGIDHAGIGTLFTSDTGDDADGRP